MCGDRMGSFRPCKYHFSRTGTTGRNRQDEQRGKRRGGKGGGWGCGAQKGRGNCRMSSSWNTGGKLRRLKFPPWNPSLGGSPTLPSKCSMGRDRIGGARAAGQGGDCPGEMPRPSAESPSTTCPPSTEGKVLAGVGPVSVGVARVSSLVVVVGGGPGK